MPDSDREFRQKSKPNRFSRPKGSIFLFLNGTYGLTIPFTSIYTVMEQLAFKYWIINKDIFSFRSATAVLMLDVVLALRVAFLSSRS